MIWIIVICVIVCLIVMRDDDINRWLRKKGR